MTKKLEQIGFQSHPSVFEFFQLFTVSACNLGNQISSEKLSTFKQEVTQYYNFYEELIAVMSTIIKIWIKIIL